MIPLPLILQGVSAASGLLAGSGLAYKDIIHKDSYLTRTVPHLGYVQGLGSNMITESSREKDAKMNIFGKIMAGISAATGGASAFVPNIEGKVKPEVDNSNMAITRMPQDFSNLQLETPRINSMQPKEGWNPNFIQMGPMPSAGPVNNTPFDYWRNNFTQQPNEIGIPNTLIPPLKQQDTTNTLVSPEIFEPYKTGQPNINRWRFPSYLTDIENTQVKLNRQYKPEIYRGPYRAQQMSGIMNGPYRNSLYTY